MFVFARESVCLLFVRFITDEHLFVWLLSWILDIVRSNELMHHNYARINPPNRISKPGRTVETLLESAVRFAELTRES